MPVKARASKRRAPTLAPYEAWPRFFVSGADYLGELEPFGFDRYRDQGRAQQAARAAWRRYGSEFMARWRAQPGNDQRDPWALIQFGEPKCQ